ncbi:MAG: O-antigen ligase family protein [Bdellovibrionales bacterium]
MGDTNHVKTPNPASFSVTDEEASGRMESASVRARFWNRETLVNWFKAPSPNNFGINAAFWLYTFGIILSPVGLGGNRPIAFGLAQLALAASCVLLAKERDFWRNIRFFKRLRVAMALFALVICWAFIQTLPVVPESWTHPLWSETAATLGQSVTASISVAPEDAIKGLVRLVTYAIACAIAFVLLQDSRRARRFLDMLWATGVMICAYGLVVYLAGIQKILWFDKWAYNEDLTSTFVNHNHFAIYAAMILTCGVARLAQSWRELMRTKPASFARALRDWLGREGLPQGFMIAMVLLCIVLSHSRAGLTLALVGLGAWVLLFQVYLRAWRKVWLAGLGTIVVLAAVLVFAVHTSERFSVLFSDYSSLDRLKAYTIGWHALLDNPWLGYGLNGYEPEFRLYQHDMRVEFNHAHNDWLESLLDLGVPMALALWAAIGLLLSGLAHGILNRRRFGLYPTLGLAASVMALGHALVDFDLQIPGVVLTWLSLVGMGLAQSWSHAERDEEGEQSGLKPSLAG